MLLAGRTWAIRYTEGKRRKYAGGYLTKADAELALANITTAISGGLPGMPVRAKASPLFREVTESWFAERAANANAADDHDRWMKHLDPVLSDRALDSVDSAFLSSHVAELKKPVVVVDPKTKEKTTKVLSGASVERVLYLLSAFYRFAIRSKRFQGENPVRAYLASLQRVERQKIRTHHDPKDTPFLERKEDVARLFRALPEPVNIAYALSALAGLRPGETLALEWADVDLVRGKITVRRHVRHGRVGAPKSGKPRTVDMVPSLRSVLTQWREKTPGALVVPPIIGSKHLGPKYVSDALKTALKKLGLPALTFYEAGRHSFASQWVLAGLDIYRLSEIMGHAQVTTTMHYAHLTKQTPADVLARADVAL